MAHGLYRACAVPLRQAALSHIGAEGVLNLISDTQRAKGATTSVATEGSESSFWHNRVQW